MSIDDMLHKLFILSLYIYIQVSVKSVADLWNVGTTIGQGTVSVVVDNFVVDIVAT